MAIHIGGAVLKGEIRNSKRNTVSGWIELDRAAVHDGQSRESQDLLMLFELTGNLVGELAGRNFRFEAPRPETEMIDRCLGADFVMRQMGVMGDSRLHSVGVRPVSANDSLEPHEAGLDPPGAELPCLTIRWFGQNGSVILDLINPKIEFEGSYNDLADPVPEPLPPANEAGAGVEEDMLVDGDGNTDHSSTEEEADPAGEIAYGLFPDDFEEQIRNSAAVDDVDGTYDPSSDASTTKMGRGRAEKRDWDEVIPGITPETKAMYEQWDEVIDGLKDEPLTWLFQGPLQLPKPEQVEDEDHAWRMLQLLLSEMAMRGVAFHMCEHYTAMRAYQLLIDEILPEAHVHPNLIATGFTQNYMTHEFCDECNAET
jgi:hypothetical protein